MIVNFLPEHIKKLQEHTFYLSGKMTGVDGFNYDTFNEAAGMLRRLFTVINPAENFDGASDRHRYEYMSLDLKNVVNEATAIIVLPGWRESPGAKLEVQVAHEMNKPVFFYLNHEDGDLRSVEGYELVQLSPDHLDRIFNPLYGISSWEADGRADLDNDEDWPDDDSDDAPEETILDEAARLTSKDRQAIYGKPSLDFSRTAGMLTSLLSSKLKDGEKITSLDIPLIMVCVKLSRLVQSPEHRDSLVDICGYANTYKMVLEERATDHHPV